MANNNIIQFLLCNSQAYKTSYKTPTMKSRLIFITNASDAVQKMACDYSGKRYQYAISCTPDWNQTLPYAQGYIKNKPTKVSQFTNDADYVASTGTIAKAVRLAEAVKIKLTGGATGQVTFDGSSDATIQTVVNASLISIDWSQLTGTAPDLGIFSNNALYAKVAQIPTDISQLSDSQGILQNVGVQSDWAQSDSTQKSFIKNKPVIVKNSGQWSDSTCYSKDNLVTYNYSSWISLADDNVGHTPQSDSAWWSIFAARGQPGEQGQQGQQGEQGETGPQGQKGDRGQSFNVDQTGPKSQLSQYNRQQKGFSFLATDQGNIYIKDSSQSGDWSQPLPFTGRAAKFVEITADAQVGQQTSASVSDSGSDANKNLHFHFTLQQGPQGQAAGFGTIDAQAQTVSQSQPASVIVSDSGSDTAKNFHFYFQIPRGRTGAQGQQGQQGIQGIQGIAAGFGTIDTQTQTISQSQPAKVSVSDSGSDAHKNFHFYFQIPRGAKGQQGIQGQKGQSGSQGIPGAAAGFGIIDATAVTVAQTAQVSVSDSGSNTSKNIHFHFSIPRGQKGQRGQAFKISQTGPLVELITYNRRQKGFSYLATDTGNVYIKESSQSGDWSDPVPFRGEAAKITQVTADAYQVQQAVATVSDSGSDTDKRFHFHFGLRRGAAAKISEVTADAVTASQAGATVSDSGSDTDKRFHFHFQIPPGQKLQGNYVVVTQQDVSNSYIVLSDATVPVAVQVDGVVKDIQSIRHDTVNKKFLLYVPDYLAANNVSSIVGSWKVWRAGGKKGDQGQKGNLTSETAWNVYPNSDSISIGQHQVLGTILSPIAACMTQKFSIRFNTYTATDNPLQYCDGVIDWGDNTVTVIKDGAVGTPPQIESVDVSSMTQKDGYQVTVKLAHTYAAQGLYKVSVKGTSIWSLSHVSTNNLLCGCFTQELPLSTYITCLISFGAYAYRLTKLNCAWSIDFNNCQNLGYCFQYCYNLQYAYGFKRKLCQTNKRYIAYMFMNCTGLVDTDCMIPKSVVDAAGSISNFYGNCTSLTTSIAKLIPISGFNDTLMCANSLFVNTQITGTVPASLLWGDISKSWSYLTSPSLAYINFSCYPHTYPNDMIFSICGRGVEQNLTSVVDVQKMELLDHVFVDESTSSPVPDSAGMYTLQSDNAWTYTSVTTGIKYTLFRDSAVTYWKLKYIEDGTEIIKNVTSTLADCFGDFWLKAKTGYDPILTGQYNRQTTVVWRRTVTSSEGFKYNNAFYGCSDAIRAQVPVQWGGKNFGIIVPDTNFNNYYNKQSVDTKIAAVSQYTRKVIYSQDTLSNKAWALVTSSCTVTLPEAQVGNYIAVTPVQDAQSVVVKAAQQQLIQSDSQVTLTQCGVKTQWYCITAGSWTRIQGGAGISQSQAATVAKKQALIFG